MDERPTMMIESKRWTSLCQDPEDGSGDLIVDLPPELLEEMGLAAGDELDIAVADGLIILSPKQSPSS
ncbi:AbrB/MazE/SpoVT family DNA-binding domain-containing protein [Pseudomonas fluorescens]|uniref:AbrB/MazE/SpoVT family DNA-binding domain-containing protein n=1 Tax=Pseudomonas fluorescens TaxID=294 RepID=UPI0029667A28|nr:AbrB/MazE/SpoVT family DNA-binding domain-containing protein [Pseudomonas fluorescens]